MREQARIRASEGDDGRASSPHPIIERTLSAIRKAKSSNTETVAVNGPGVIKCEVASASADRLAVVLPKVVRAALLQGFDLTASDGPAKFKSEIETVDFSITESIRREQHVMTAAERSKEEAWERKRDRAARRNSWDDLIFDGPRFPEWDYHPTGQLSVEFEQVYVFRGTAPRRSFRDAKVQRLENMASDIAVGLAVLAAAKTEERLRREAEQRRADEERRHRELAARIKHIEDRRIAGLSSLLSEFEELDRLRRLIDLLNAEVSVASTPRLSAFLAWTSEHLEKRKARLSAQGIEHRFEKEHLFGDDDDHGFAQSTWY